MLPTVEERRLKRAARREKQRQANIGRAAKMHVARIEREESEAGSAGQIRRSRRAALYWLLRMVLLALARRFLPG